MSASSLPAAPVSVDTSDDHRPYVPDDARIPELTWSAVLLGSVLGIIFGASSLYLFLKVGMTVSASIPVAVLAVTLFRWLSQLCGTRRATILENNIVQTAGSAGESIAFGVGAAMPALMLLGYELEWTRVMLVAVLGGLLGILMMIPLRRAFVVKQHRQLKYPEGTACAKVLVAGEQGGSNARMVFQGFGVGFVYQLLMQALKLWSDVPSRAITGIAGYEKAELSLEPSPALLGVGYILGFRISAIMVGGGLLASLMLIPAIALFGQQQTEPLAPATVLIRDMSAGQIWSFYVRYIGAGAVAAAGIISMLRALPMIFGSIRSGLRDLGGNAASRAQAGTTRRRTERDLPMSLVLLGSLALIGALAGSNLIPTNLVGRIVGGCLIVLFGFLFVTVSSRITGEMGSSSNPISGMTIATLLLTCAVFVVLGWIGPEFRLTALSIAAVVCIASSNGGTTSQDLKTGFLVGATPWAQQVAILIGALTSALVIGGTLLLLNWAYTTTSDKATDLPTQKADVTQLTQSETGPDGQSYRVWQAVGVEGVIPGKYLVDESGQARYLVDPGIGGRMTTTQSGQPIKKFDPPQPRLFAVLIDGIMSRRLPWGLVMLGVALTLVLQLIGVPSLAFAVGVYLPLSTTLPIFLGGLLRMLVDRVRQFSEEESDTSPGVLMSTGLIAGGSLAGIGLVALVAMENVAQAIDFSSHGVDGVVTHPISAVLAFGVLMAILAWAALRGPRPLANDDAARRTSNIEH
ncbi:MAG: oligopeptide transporter, OPT family [Pirellulaceae bacterium]|jgi:putative OPT family oligopeptide transporter|nr:oligopeptide transporter, OPT family [Pirellulaceae bacterium]